MPTSLQHAEPAVRRRTMSAARITAPLTAEIVDAPIPQPGPGQVRVRLEGCGVCASNIAPWEGRPWFNYPLEPGQLGHEGWGVIDAVGDGVTQFTDGQRVAFLSNHSFAEYDVADVGAVVALPEALGDQLFPAEPLGCAVNIFRRSEVLAGQTVAIIGMGFLGALLTQLAAGRGARVIAVSRREDSLAMARRMGAEETLHLDDDQLVARITELTDGKLCPRVIECTGKQRPLDLAGELTQERGRLIVAGYHQDGPRQVNMQLWNWRGLDVINAHERDPRVYLSGMNEASQLVAQGLLKPSPLLTHRFALEQLAEALEATRHRPAGFFKALVTLP